MKTTLGSTALHPHSCEASYHHTQRGPSGLLTQLQSGKPTLLVPEEKAPLRTTTKENGVSVRHITALLWGDI